MSMHTPGPWYVSTADGSGDSLYVGGMVLQSPYTAFAARASIPNVLEKIDRETLYANAILMATAPNLLNALQGLLAICDDADASHPAINAARAAIAKATGGES